MTAVMVRYRVKPDRVAENEEYISKVFAELSREKPSGFRYVSFKLEDGVSFVHIVLEQASDFNLAEMPAFKALVADIADRCDEPPVATGMTAVGSYRFIEGGQLA
jgi:hypothetical protein